MSLPPVYRRDAISTGCTLSLWQGPLQRTTRCMRHQGAMQRKNTLHLCLLQLLHCHTCKLHAALWPRRLQQHTASLILCDGDELCDAVCLLQTEESYLPLFCRMSLKSVHLILAPDIAKRGALLPRRAQSKELALLLRSVSTYAARLQQSADLVAPRAAPAYYQLLQRAEVLAGDCYRHVQQCNLSMTQLLGETEGLHQQLRSVVESG